MTNQLSHSCYGSSAEGVQQNAMLQVEELEVTLCFQSHPCGAVVSSAERRCWGAHT